GQARQAGCSEQGLPSAVYPERTSHRVSRCLPGCAGVVRRIPGLVGPSGARLCWGAAEPCQGQMFSF
ncbi:mCG145138, partial [Mus musculus]